MADLVEYLVGEWEHNGYDDSDFHALYWSPEKGFRSEMVGSTRYPSPYGADPKLHPKLPESLMPELRKYLAELVLPGLKSAASSRVMAPSKVEKGNMVKALAAGKFVDKRSGAVVEWAEGEVGKVFWFGYFGKFYRNGYNRPGRSNGRVGVEFPSGRVFMPLSKLRLAAEVPSEEELREEAERYASGNPLSVYRGSMYMVGVGSL